MFAIDGVEVRTPNDFKIEYNPITEAERSIDTASMLISPIAGKLKITWTYTAISGADLMKILGATWDKFNNSNTAIFSINTLTPNGERTIKAYFAPNGASTSRIGATPETTLWRDYSLVWVEQ